MSDPELIDRILQTCSYRFRNVMCPNKDKIAKIAAANCRRMMRNGPGNRLRHDVFVERDRSFQVVLTSAANHVPLAVVLRRAEFAPEGSQPLHLQRRHIDRDDDAPLRSGNAGQRQFA
jgi:hypothetical protein